MSFDIKQKITRLRLAGNWQGLVAERWPKLFFAPDQLLENPTVIFKSDKGNSTVLKEIGSGNSKSYVVVKKNINRTGVRAFVDFVRYPKSVRNFRLAAILKLKGLEVAEPVAALWNRQKGSIYITEYIQNSLNLYDIVFGKNKEILANFSIRKTVIKRTAEIVAKLHKSNYWHRDSKAGNFIVYKDNSGEYKIKLIDLDGIKKSIVVREKNCLRTLSRLAETLTRFNTVNFTDLYRGFLCYCSVMGISSVQARKLFYKAEKLTVATRLLTIIADSYKIKDK